MLGCAEPADNKLMYLIKLSFSKQYFINLLFLLLIIPTRWLIYAFFSLSIVAILPVVAPLIAITISASFTVYASRLSSLLTFKQFS